MGSITDAVGQVGPHRGENCKKVITSLVGGVQGGWLSRKSRRGSERAGSGMRDLHPDTPTLNIANYRLQLRRSLSWGGGLSQESFRFWWNAQFQTDVYYRW